MQPIGGRPIPLKAESWKERTAVFNRSMYDQARTNALKECYKDLILKVSAVSLCVHTCKLYRSRYCWWPSKHHHNSSSSSSRALTSRGSGITTPRPVADDEAREEDDADDRLVRGSSTILPSSSLAMPALTDSKCGSSGRGGGVEGRVLM